jgi:hypothetical protein
MQITWQRANKKCKRAPALPLKGAPEQMAGNLEDMGRNHGGRRAGEAETSVVTAKTSQ